jgi:ABC-type transporter Mla subunit MlaD
MTGEEMERAIEFLLQSQANHEARLGELTAQIAETNRQLQTYAETQSEFIGIVTRNIEALTEAQAQTDARLNKTDERLNKLIGLFEQHIVTGH